MFRVDSSAASVFIRQFTINPLQVGSLFPSSRWLGEKMLRGLEPNKVQVVVEYGPGTGSFTSLIHGFLSPRSRYVACEPNPAFCELLRIRFPHLELVLDYADAAPQYLGDDVGNVDLVVSGLPFSLMKWEKVAKTLEETHRILKVGGEFRTFVYFHTMLAPQVRRLIKDLRGRFSEVSFDSAVLNFPPAVVIRAKK